MILENRHGRVIRIPAIVLVLVRKLPFRAILEPNYFTGNNTIPDAVDPAHDQV